jgi:two-component system nitrate/nitrite response regulator NarL
VANIVTMKGTVGRSKIVVAIVDDHELFAQGLALLLTREWGDVFTVGGQTTYVEEAADLVADCHADVAIVDLTMPPLGGVAAIRHIKTRCPTTRVLALSGTDDLGLAQEALRAGAHGFLPKTARPEALAGPLWTVAEGLRVIEGAVLDDLLSQTRRPPIELLGRLSDQDLKLWTLLAAGLENAEMADRLLVSERTAKRMVATLLNKLGVTNRISAAAMAGEFGLLDIHDRERSNARPIGRH